MLVWLDLLKERLKERQSELSVYNFGDNGLIKEFIKPLIEHGEKEEAKIRHYFKGFDNRLIDRNVKSK